MCEWRWAWSYQNPAPGATFPPRTPACLVHQSDSVRLENSDAEPRLLTRVRASAVAACDVTHPLDQTAIPPHAGLSLNLSRALQVSREVHWVSDRRNGSCLHGSFSLTNQTLRGCHRAACVSQVPCFRSVSLPLRSAQSADCQLARGDWIRVHNPDTSHRTFSAPNLTRTLAPGAETLLAPVSGNGTFQLNDSTANLSVSLFPPNQLTCSAHLCSHMDPSPLLNPLAAALLSGLLLLAAVSVLLALCLRKGKAISSEECPPPPGEMRGKYEMKSDEKLARTTEVKLREKKASTAATGTPSDPDPDPAAGKEKMIQKRSSQFAELLSKFN